MNWLYSKKNMPHILDVKGRTGGAGTLWKCSIVAGKLKKLDRVIDFDEFCEMVLIGGNQ